MMTLNEFFAAFMKRSEPTYKVSTIVTYNDYWRQYIADSIGTKKLNKISRQDLFELRNELAKRVSGRRTNSAVRLVKMVINEARMDELITTNPTQSVNNVDQKKSKIDPYSLEELQCVLSELSDAYKPFFTVLAWTGMRPCEISALRWSDIDMTKHVVSVDKARSRDGSEAKPKTDAGIRKIPMLPPVVEVFERLKAGAPDGYVFRNNAGNPVDFRMAQVWKRAETRAGVRHRPSYNLRHTFGSTCVSNGVYPSWVSRVMGHATMKVTMAHYLSDNTTGDTVAFRSLNSLFAR